MSDYLDPVIAAVVGDISDLLAKIAEAQGAMAEFAGSAPAIQFDPGALAGVESAAADTAAQMAQAEQEAAMSAEELAAAIMGPMAVSEEEIARTVAETEQLTQAADELVVSLEEESAWAQQLGAQLQGLAAEEEAAGDAAADSGEKAKAASVNWLMLGLGFAGLEFGVGAGVLALSAAVVGIGYLISDFGGEAKGDLQEVENAFRGTAAAASQAFEPALNEITQGLVGTVRAVEPEIAQIFQELSGPAEAFFQGLDTSVEQGMAALVPAIGALGPEISTITSDLGPLLTGIAGFVQQMAQAFTAAGGNQELSQLAQEIGSLLPVVGELVGEVGGGLLPIAEALTPVLEAVGNVLNALGPNFDTAIAVGLLLGKTWSLLGPAADAVDSAITSLQGMLAEYTAGSEMAAAASTEVGAALDAEAVEALAATAAFADAVAALIPFIAVAAAVGLAGYELVDHWSAVSDFFQQAASDAYQWGSDIGEGIGRGLTDAWNFIVQPIENSINGIKNMFTSGFGIMSPSTVMREYGQYIGQGLALGIDDSAGLTHAAAAGMTAATLGAFGSLGAAGLGAGAAAAPTSAVGGQGGATVVQLTVQIQGQPFYVASAAEIEEVLLPVLQQLNLRNGTTMTAVTGGRT